MNDLIKLNHVYVTTMDIQRGETTITKDDIVLCVCNASSPDNLGHIAYFAIDDSMSIQVLLNQREVEIIGEL